MEIPYEPPKLKSNAFNCPHCHALSTMFWDGLYAPSEGGSAGYKSGFMVASCRRCKGVQIWEDAKMVYPLESTAPMATADFPKDALIDYNEARNVLMFSPRSACLLLRLCIEKVINELEPGSSDLNEKIGKLVANGLDPGIQKALDSVRVIGGQAAHPLQMDLKDKVDTADSLFSLVNIIVESTISKKKKIDEIYKKLPKEKVDAINDRDKNTK